jgi:hypothetical protein
METKEEETTLQSDEGKRSCKTRVMESHNEAYITLQEENPINDTEIKRAMIEEVPKDKLEASVKEELLSDEDQDTYIKSSLQIEEEKKAKRKLRSAGKRRKKKENEKKFTRSDEKRKIMKLIERKIKLKG